MMLNSNQNSNMAILVVSCDKYSDLWEPFFELLEIYWPDCHYSVYLGTNQKKVQRNNVTTICIGEDKSWSDNIAKMLAVIKEQYVLLLLEDFFLEQRVDTKKINGLLEIVKEKEIDCLRLCPEPPAKKIMNREFMIGEISFKAPYVISTQPSIWRKTALLSLLHEGYSAWDFEKKNSEAIKKMKKILKIWGCNDYVIKRHNGVERGKYYTSTLELFKQNNIFVDESQRGVIDDKTFLKKLHMKIYKLQRVIRAKILG